jgi:glycerol-3-phosphate O-acyltransferase
MTPKADPSPAAASGPEPPGWIDRFLKGTRHHFLCSLPEKPGALSGLVLRLFYSGLTIGEDQTEAIKNLPRSAVVVYAMQHYSKFEHLFYYIFYKRGNLPVPEIGFDRRWYLWQPIARIFRAFLVSLDAFLHRLPQPDPYASGYIRKELMAGKAGLLNLVGRKGFRRRFIKMKTDPLQYLLDMQKSSERPIYIFPHLMFYGKKPARSIPSLMDMIFGPEQKPGILRRLFIMFTNPRKIFVEVSAPMSLQAFLDHPRNRERSIEHQALVLRRRLLMRFDRHRQSILGPTLKSREELKESVFTGESLKEFIDNYSRNRNIPVEKVRRKSDAYLMEIAAKYSPGLIETLSHVLNWVINQMFDGFSYNQDGFNRMKAVSRRGPLILIPCHKSHIDYLMISFIMYRNNMPCPLIAAGKNLSFWPLGPLFRNAGAFFIRRTFKGAALYSRVFMAYIHKILQDGHNIEFFIEGTRSRTGKLLMPKLGLLSMLINAYRNGACEDLIFAPIYIGYDRVLEESSYMHELEGGKKEPENIRQVLRLGKFLKKRYGRIYIGFHDPISIKALLERNGTPIGEMSSKDQNLFCRNLGFRILNAIDRQTVVTPHALVASALLNCGKERISESSLHRLVSTLMNHLGAVGASLTDTLVLDASRAIAQVIDIYVQRKFIEKVETEKEGRPVETAYQLTEAKRPLLEYYKNNSISYFVPGAFTAAAILARDAFQFSTRDLYEEYRFLRDFFKNEFAYDVDRPLEATVRKTVKAFIDDAVLMPHPTLPDTYNITSAGFRKLRLFASFVRTYFESYWIVLNVFMSNSRETLATKDRTKKAVSMGNKIFKRKGIARREALYRVNFQNAVDFFAYHGIRGSEDIEKIEAYAAPIQRYLSILPQ